MTTQRKLEYKANTSPRLTPRADIMSFAVLATSQTSVNLETQHEPAVDGVETNTSK